MKLYPLPEYIDKFHDGNQSSFAREAGVQRAQVTQWLQMEIVIVVHQGVKTMYRQQRVLGS